jgi:ADP-ribose pyrophosphatase YjhB (NUDIX family)
MINCAFENGNPASLRHVVADVLVLKDNKLLMVKRAAKMLEGGKWGLVGGFAERDELVVETAAREVLEETGWQVTNLKLLTINDQSNRPGEDRQNVAFVFFGQATAKTGEPDDESDDQQWFGFDELPPASDIAFDHADNIALYQRYLKENLDLPILTSMD